MSKYQLDQIVDAIVESVLPFGIFVRLDDGTTAYIRRRELDLDQDVDPGSVFRAGYKITAKVIALETGKNIELSRRQTLPDPWPQFARRFRQGDTVLGIVRALHPDGVFIRVEAGINGFVSLPELATWQVSKPEDLLWLGDEIEAVIINLDANDKRLTLSIKERLEQRAQVMRIFEQVSTHKEAETPTRELKKELLPLTIEERERIGEIIVIDDNDDIRKGLVEWLQQRGYQASTAQTRDEILAHLRQGEHGVLFVDIHLDNKDGLELIQSLQLDENGIYVCVMSNPEWLLERAEEIRSLKVFQAFEKPLQKEDIDQFLRSLAHDEAPQPVWQNMPQQKYKESESQSLKSILRDVSSKQRLLTVLTRLVELMRAEKGIIFDRDPVSQAFSILAQTESLPIQQDAIYSLRESPVKDILAENSIVVEGHATENTRFDKLLELLPFESCIGAPIEVMGEVRYVLFLFHRKPDAFGRVRQTHIQTDVLWLSTILEEQAIRERLHRMNPLLLSGELSLGLAHEVYNKVSSLELLLANIASSTPLLTDPSTVLTDLQTAVVDLKTLVGTYQQMMRAKEALTTFVINDVVCRAEILVRPLARKAQVKMDLRLSDNLPQITGNSIALQQVFFNIMLNAVQMMEHKPSKYRLLEITTSYQPEQHKLPLLIRFTDTGPGIHKQLWEKIFDMGYSTRDGSGLGLYVTRSLVEIFDGEIKVEESAVPLGTTFLVKLPVTGQEKKK